MKENTFANIGMNYITRNGDIETHNCKKGGDIKISSVDMEDEKNLVKVGKRTNIRN